MKFYLLKDHPESTSFLKIIFKGYGYLPVPIIKAADISQATIYLEAEYDDVRKLADENGLYLYEVNATLTLIPKENATSK